MFLFRPYDTRHYLITDVVGAVGGFLVPDGGTVSLSCPISSSSLNIDWAKVIPGPNSSREGYDKIVEDCVIKPGYTSLYRISTTGSCDLVIFNAREPHGGRYVCYDVNGAMSEEIFLSVVGN